MSDSASGIPRLAFRLSLVSIAAFLLGPIGAYLGLTKPMTGFAVFAIGGLLGVASLILGLIGYFRSSGTEKGIAGRGIAFGGIISVIFITRILLGGGVPRINDITTDFERVPKFVKALEHPDNAGRDMTYPGASFAEQQRKAYPDVVALLLPDPPPQAYAKVLAAAKTVPSWTITRDDPAALALEGTATSNLFRFQDDFVIEIRPDVGGSVVHMRSKSRNGQGDFGVNAQRIRDFFAKLKA